VLAEQRTDRVRAGVRAGHQNEVVDDAQVSVRLGEQQHQRRQQQRDISDGEYACRRVGDEPPDRSTQPAEEAGDHHQCQPGQQDPRPGELAVVLGQVVRGDQRQWGAHGDRRVDDVHADAGERTPDLEGTDDDARDQEDDEAPLPPQQRAQDPGVEDDP